jgi:hypothetical protein
VKVLAYLNSDTYNNKCLAMLILLLAKIEVRPDEIIP